MKPIEEYVKIHPTEGLYINYCTFIRKPKGLFMGAINQDALMDLDAGTDSGADIFFGAFRPKDIGSDDMLSLDEVSDLDICGLTIDGALCGVFVAEHKALFMEAIDDLNGSRYCGGRLNFCTNERLKELMGLIVSLDQLGVAEVNVYESQDVPGNFGFSGCDSDCYETQEAAIKAAREQYKDTLDNLFSEDEDQKYIPPNSVRPPM